ncbi:hypothetical protein MYX04_13240, partial [Nitrospiraceae bacterium AH_259_D15_M11_P09]|nr:hypothetical protein [Nitrospiraceae bacterium AH_259_D15_M11_P09]
CVFSVIASVVRPRGSRRVAIDANDATDARDATGVYLRRGVGEDAMPGWINEADCWRRARQADGSASHGAC